MTRGRWMVVAGVVVLATIVAVVALAQQPSEPGMMGQGGMMGMCPLHAGMMGGMMGRSALAVEGKSIYVLAGNKLLKYDANLKLVREAEIKMDMAKMNMMMQKMMEQCPMRKQMMEQMQGMMGKGQQ